METWGNDLRMSDSGFPYRLPAEWEEQACVWLSWPVSRHIWPGHRLAIEEKFAEIVAVISRYEYVKINAVRAHHDSIRETLNRARADLTVIEFWDHPTDDVWCRDHGPLFIRHQESGEVAVSDWKFNAWGGKFEPFDQDDAVPRRIADALEMQCFSHDFVLEGGAIESNGAGTLLTTEAVLLNPNRYAAPSRAVAEASLADGLGARRVIWLKDGLLNDDTDGHIDNISRFVGEDAVLTVVDSVQPQLLENAQRLRQAVGTVLELPLPELVLHDGEPLPASYANFLIINDAVVVPVFGQSERDERALGIIGDCFPGRKTESIDARLLLLEGGAIHCLSMQQPTWQPPPN